MLLDRFRMESGSFARKIDAPPGDSNTKEIHETLRGVTRASQILGFEIFQLHRFAGGTGWGFSEPKFGLKLIDWVHKRSEISMSLAIPQLSDPRTEHFPEPIPPNR